MTSCRIEIILGPMFSGKSTELMRRCSRKEVIGKKVCYINHTFDTRTGDFVQTHAQHRKDAIKLFCVEASIVRRHPDAHDEALRTRGIRQRDHRPEVSLGLGDWQASQAIVCAEFENHDIRLIFFKRRGKPAQAACGGLPGDTCIHNAVREPFLF